MARHNRKKEPEMFSRAWFIGHMKKRLNELTDKYVEINNRLMDQHNVCAARDWPREDEREFKRLLGLLKKAGEFRTRARQDLVELYAEKKEGWPLLGEGIDRDELG